MVEQLSIAHASASRYYSFVGSSVVLPQIVPAPPIRLAPLLLVTRPCQLKASESLVVKHSF
jgi:hypothetical protein